MTSLGISWYRCLKSKKECLIRVQRIRKSPKIRRKQPKTCLPFFFLETSKLSTFTIGYRLVEAAFLKNVSDLTSRDLMEKLRQSVRLMFDAKAAGECSTWPTIPLGKLGPMLYTLHFEVARRPVVRPTPMLIIPIN